MIRIRPGIFVLAAAAIVALPHASSAQTPEPALPAAVPAEAKEWLEEFQQLHGRLTELQQRALEDPELSARQDSLGNHIKVAMESIDPTLPETMGRIDEMERQAAEAQAAQDEARLQELQKQAAQIEQQFFTAQQQALQRPDLAAEMLEFQSLLQQKILETDPEAPALMARFQELEQKLSGLQQQ
jgi:cell fate (sporulation/competence/biofilm development) regulator YlbF (YheA/YmcA/DUF963 family)